ncbi:MAG: HDOD domain-containing protein [Phycisphaerae bacterium]|jgi:HD-like signal output (HDOD) protein
MRLFSLLRGVFGRSGRDVDTDAPESLPSPPPTVAVAVEPDVPDGPPGWWVPRGPPVLAPPTPAGVRVARTLYDRCARAVDDPTLELPQLPHVGQQLLAMLHAEDVSFPEAAELAGQDPALAADLLRVVNSVAYRGINEIRRLDLALARLGRRAAHSLVLTASVKRIAIRLGGAHRTLGEQLWRRSVASAVVAGVLGTQRNVPEEEAFLIGLLHDIGLLAVLKIVHDFQQSEGRPVSRAAFDALGARWHEHLGLRLADAWNLPDPLPELLGNHHHLPGDADPLAGQRLLLQVTDVVCSLLEYAPYVPYDFFNLDCVQRFGLTDTRATRALLTDLPEQIAGRLEVL